MVPHRMQGLARRMRLDTLFRIVPWWAAALAIHAVFLVHLMSLGLQPPLPAGAPLRAGLDPDEGIGLVSCVADPPRIGNAGVEPPSLPPRFLRFCTPEGEDLDRPEPEITICPAADHEAEAWNAELSPTQARRLFHPPKLGLPQK